MKIALIALVALTVATAVNAQNWGTISGPDPLGQRTFRYDNGVNGTISARDPLGNTTIRYFNNGYPSFQTPNYNFGGFNQPRVMPRSNVFNQY